MTSPLERSSEQSISLGWLDALTRHRKIAYALLACIYVCSFNGIWRVGVDSALYRGLAHSLANHGKYVFAGEQHTHAYAGFPLMLAAIEKVFGTSELPPLIMISLMGVATLFLIDALLRLRYPLWVATVITLGVGLNYRFVRQSQELMTDIPFALGVMMSLYAYERLKTVLDRRSLIRMTATLIAGLLLAATTRPTFGVLAIALAIGSAYYAYTNLNGRRAIHLTIVGGVFVVAALFILADPRTNITAPFDGRYELELRDAVKILPTTILGQLHQFLGGNLNDAFFSQDMTPFSIPLSLLVLAGGVMVWRRNAVWGMMIFGLVLVTLPLSTVPRYYIMVMPMLWLGWVLLVTRLTLRSPAKFQGAVMMIGLGLPLVLNTGRVIGFIGEQHHADYVALRDGVSRRDAFYATYRGGAVAPLLELASLIKANTKPDDTIIGPSAHILSYFADRRVLGERSIFFEKALSTYPRVLQKVEADYAVYPMNLYQDTDPTIRDLMRRRLVVTTGTVARNDVGYLATIEVRLAPEGVKWTDYNGPEARAAAATRRTKGLSAAEKAEIAKRKERKLEQEKRIRREKREAKLEREARAERQERAERREAQERRERAEKLRRQEAKERREAQERRDRKAARERKAKRGNAPASQPAAENLPAPQADASLTRPVLLWACDYPLTALGSHSALGQRSALGDVPAWLIDFDA